MAGKDFGGRMRVRLSSGSLLSLRGTFSLMQARQSVETVTNQDGSLDRTATPTSPRASVTFKDGDVDLAALMEAPRQNVVINEEFSGVTHHFISAVFAGDPESNRMNGEVGGLTIVGEVYRRTGG